MVTSVEFGEISMSSGPQPNCRQVNKYQRRQLLGVLGLKYKHLFLMVRRDMSNIFKRWTPGVQYNMLLSRKTNLWHYGVKDKLFHNIPLAELNTDGGVKKFKEFMDSIFKKDDLSATYESYV